MFGIKHCVYYKCIMNGSSYKAQRFLDMINKNFEPCPICLRKLQLNIEFDIEERYKKMKDFCQTQDENFKDEVEKY